VQLSEKIMRVLILRGDHLTKEDMEKETPIAIMERQGTSPQAEPEQQAEQGYQKRYKKVEQLDQAPEPVKEAKIEDNPQPAAGGDTTT
jgi:hypothetical protein